MAGASSKKGLKRSRRGNGDDNVVVAKNSGAEPERKRFKHLEDHAENESREERTTGVANKSSAKDRANPSPAAGTLRTDGIETLIAMICKSLQKTQNLFRIDVGVDGNEERGEVVAKYDNEILVFDSLERMQRRSVPITLGCERDIQLESTWICKQAFERKTLSIQDTHLTTKAKQRTKTLSPSKIRILLTLMRNQRFEVPFIAFYHKQSVLPELNINDLWKIYKFDAKWCQLKSHKEALVELYEQMKSYQVLDKSLPKHARYIDSDDMEQLENAQTIEELKTFYHHFMLRYGLETSTMQNNEEPAIVDKHSYYFYCQIGLDSLAVKFGLSSKQFAENLSQKRRVHDVKQQPMPPRDLALSYINDVLKTPEVVLQAAQLVMAMQIAREPLVKETIRQLYIYEKAKMTVRPTEKGMTQLVDENHPIYSMKYLKDKPVSNLAGEEYLKLAMAQDDQLIKITFSYEIEENLVERMKQLYHRDEPDKHVLEWNSLRAGSVEMALAQIASDVNRELHSILLKEAKDCVMRHCTHKMYNWIKIAPYPYSSSDYAEDDVSSDKNGLRVIGVAYECECEPTSTQAFACMTANGECTGYICLPNLLNLTNNSRPEDNASADFVLNRMKDFVVRKRPHVIAIGGASSDAHDIAQNFRQMIASLVATKELPNVVAVEIVDNGPAVVYSTSRQARTEFTSYPVVLLQAISLARRMRDPLVEFLKLCNENDEILDLKFHSLQDQLPKADLRDNVYLEFVNRVNEVGVDFNEALQQPYFRNLLQFICGLGSLKPQDVIDDLKQMKQPLKNREELIDLSCIEPLSFYNFSGFIRIGASNASDCRSLTEFLDGSRVHPMDYYWAKRMVIDAVGHETEDVDLAFKKILESPEKLMLLNIDAYAEGLSRDTYGNKRITPCDIRSELTCRYKELRIPYRSPTDEQLFGLLAKESPADFYVGKLTQATIVAIEPDIVWIRLDNGIRGYIRFKNLSDDNLTEPEKHVRIGSRMYCRIMQIEVPKFCIEATSRGSDLVDRNGVWRLPKDRHYDNAAEMKDLAMIDKKALLDTKQLQMDAKHIITHQYFSNINYAEALKLMKTMQQGEIIIRPSSKGIRHLCLTWKVTDHVYQNIAIHDKSEKCKSSFSIRGSFWIGNLEFRDFDAIISRYVKPMIDYVSELLYFKNYKSQIMAHRDRAERLLRERKRNNRQEMPYIVSAAQDKPGKFLLSYLPRDQCQHNFIVVSPSGYKFGGQRFTNLNDLIYWFQGHYADLVPEDAAPTARN